MLDRLLNVIIDKGGLFAALWILTVWVLAKREQHWNERDAAKQRVVDELTAARIATVEKKADDMVAVTKQVVEVLTSNNATLQEVREALDNAADPRRRDDSDEPPANEPTRRGFR